MEGIVVYIFVLLYLFLLYLLFRFFKNIHFLKYKGKNKRNCASLWFTLFVFACVFLVTYLIDESFNIGNVGEMIFLKPVVFLTFVFYYAVVANLIFSLLLFFKFVR